MLGPTRRRIHQEASPFLALVAETGRDLSIGGEWDYCFID